MKIGFDLSATCLPRTGVGWYADRLIRAMAELAPENAYILYHQFGRSHHGDAKRGTQLPNELSETPYWNLPLEESQKLWANIQAGAPLEFAPDIVHATSLQAPRLPQTKLIYTVYDVTYWTVPEFTFEDNRLSSQRGMLDAMQNASGLIFISESARDEFEKVLPGWLSETRVPHAVTLLGGPEVTSPPPETERDYWLFVGALEPRKNIDGILRAHEIYWKKSNQRCLLKIAGPESWASSELHEAIEDQRVRGMVERIDYVPQEELATLYAGARAFLFPSWYEGFGLPVLEAMAAGCPVITSDLTSLPEVGGSVALYVDPNSPESIAEAMLQLERSPELADRLGREGLQWASTFTWKRTARETLNFYERVLGDS